MAVCSQASGPASLVASDLQGPRPCCPWLRSRVPQGELGLWEGRGWEWVLAGQVPHAPGRADFGMPAACGPFRGPSSWFLGSERAVASKGHGDHVRKREEENNSTHSCWREARAASGDKGLQEALRNQGLLHGNRTGGAQHPLVQGMVSMATLTLLR